MPESLSLPAPARYFPLGSGRYEVAPGLRPLGTDFGNGAADGYLFQIDTAFDHYRANKLSCRAERLGKYVVRRDYDAPVAAAVARLMTERLAAEYPNLFKRAPDSLDCRLPGERLVFGTDLRLVRVEAGAPLSPPYADAFDALCCQIPEDIAIIRAAPGRGDWIAALHLCSPSHWGAEAKIGGDFRATHAPVPGFERVNQAAPSLVAAMIERGPFVRFVWGVSGDARLNHHPEPPPGVDPAAWRGRAFRSDAEGPPCWVRVERQALWGLPEVGAALFAIRTYLLDGNAVRADPAERALLRAGLLSMSPESRAYKSVADDFDALLRWLDG